MKLQRKQPSLVFQILSQVNNFSHRKRPNFKDLNLIYVLNSFCFLPCQSCKPTWIHGFAKDKLVSDETVTNRLGKCQISNVKAAIT